MVPEVRFMVLLIAISGGSVTGAGFVSVLRAAALVLVVSANSNHRSMLTGVSRRLQDLGEW
jgi:hypothetical protein